MFRLSAAHSDSSSRRMYYANVHRRTFVAAIGQVALLSLLFIYSQFADGESHGRLYIFETLTGLCGVARYMIARRLEKGIDASEKEFGSLEVAYSAVVLLNSFCWGLIGVEGVVISGIHSDMALVTATLLAGVTSGAVATLSPNKSLTRIYVATALAPVALCLLAQPSVESVAVALSGICYIIYLWLQGGQQAEMVGKSFDESQQFRALANTSVQAMLVHENGLLRTANLQFARDFGVDVEESTGRQIASFFPPEEWTRIYDMLHFDWADSLEARAMRADGSTFPVEVKSQRYTLMGRTVFVTAIRDLSATKKIESALEASERSLKALMSTAFESLPQMVWINGPDGKPNALNRQFAEYSGVTIDQFDRGTVASMIHPDEREAAVTRWRAALNAGVALETSFRMRRASDGEYRLHMIKSSPVYDEAGVLTRWFCTAFDVEDIRLSEAARVDALDRAQIALDSAKLKSEFLANMSHEIRTPLNAIIGLTDLLMELPSSPLQVKYHRTLRESGEGLLRIINDILDFSKIESGKMDLEKIPYNLASVIEGQADLMYAKAQTKGLGLDVLVDPMLPATVIGDPGRLGQVLLNLIGNAIKFTSSGSVFVRARRMDHLADETGSGVSIRIVVEDTGMGMTQETIEKLFQPFQQADNSTARKFGGTGLGLSISHRLVHSMGGTVKIESEVGKGSRFIVTMPLAFDASTTLAAAKKQKRELPPNLHFLAVDRSAAIREIARDYLSSWGWTVDEADDKGLLTHLAGDNSRRYDALLIAMDLFDDELKRTLRIYLRQLGTLAPKVVIMGAPAGAEAAMTQDFGEKLGFTPRPLHHSNLYDAIVSTVIDVGREEVPQNQIIDLEKIDAPSLQPVPTRKILVAEDNSTNQMLITAMLRNLGYSGQMVANGLEAVAMNEQANFDLILMDCHMPELDGFEATKRIREQEKVTGRHTVIIALTANAMKEHREMCLAAGMDDYLSKPVRRIQVEEMLKRWLAADTQKAS